MRLPEKGLPQRKILDEIKQATAQDEQYQTGHILGSMCTIPHEFAIKIASLYPEKNLGDPGLFPGTSKLEAEAIQMIGDMLGDEHVVGNVVGGGSEANIIAMRVAKKYKETLEKPEVIAPETLHASFHKAADFMGFKIRTIKHDENFDIDLGEFEDAINDNTIAAVGIAGTTSLGLVDPIDKMGEIIERKNPSTYFHVDAAFGGFVLPFLRDLGHSFPKYDFSVPQVASITCDPHKMGMNLIPSGTFILREHFYKDVLGFDIPYLAGGAFKHFNVMGTRPGNVVLACWGLMRHLGREGFRKAVAGCWENTLYLRNQLRALEGKIEVAREPVINVLGIKSVSNVPMSEIDKELRKAGWYLGFFRNMNPPIERIVIMPHVTRPIIDAFVETLGTIVKRLS
ncbi:MAG: tyrosine decarboxylase MfnA [Candidatus Lokiarchaeota archaeon]|nr:tyrosine decarboxylase MfnA [Candidatus Lokiarchaeota archaeon]